MTALTTKLLEALAKVSEADTTKLGDAARRWLRAVNSERRTTRRLQIVRDRAATARPDLRQRAAVRAGYLANFLSTQQRERKQLDRELVRELARSMEIES